MWMPSFPQPKDRKKQPTWKGQLVADTTLRALGMREAAPRVSLPPIGGKTYEYDGQRLWVDGYPLPERDR